MAPTIHYRGARGFLSLAFGTPLSRVRELSGAAQLGAIVTGTVGALVDMRVWLGMLIVLIGTEWVDYWLGSERARRAGPLVWRDDVARAGRVAKIVGLLLLVSLRAMEGLVALAYPVADTHGALATAAVIAMWRAESESAERHVRALGGRGIPILSQLLAVIRAIEQWIVQIAMPRLPAPPPTPAPEERAS